MTQSGKRLLMRLMKNDVIRLLIDGEVTDYRVCKFRQNAQLALATVNESNVDSRNRDPGDSFKYLSRSPGPLRELQRPQPL